jgi:PAS domain S-box-containing protein
MVLTSPLTRRASVRYGVALAVIGLALGVNFLLAPVVHPNTFPPFLAAVMVATWFGGLGPGLTATVGTTVANAYFFMPPAPGLTLPDVSTVVRIALYAISAVLIAGLGAALRTAQLAAEARRRDAQRHAERWEAGEKRFRSLLEGIRDYAIIMLDEAGRVTSWNAGAERITGWSAGEVLGRDFSRFFAAEDVAAGRPREALRTATATRWEGQGWGVRKDGSRYWAETVIAALRDERATVTGYSLVTRDITDRRRTEEAVRASEAKFRGLLEVAPDGIVIADREGRIVLANSQAQRMFGYTAEELAGQQVEILMPESVRAAHAAHRADYHARPRTRPMGLGLDLIGQRKDGRRFPVEISLSPMGAGEEALVMSAIRDITERRKIEERVHALNRALERRVAELAAVNRELEAFSYSVSHDLRAPLRSIDGFSQALLDEYADRLQGPGQDYLRRVRAAAGRMAELIDDLLNLSRVTRQEMRREPVDLSAMARTVVAQLQRAEPDRQVEVAIADGLAAEGDPQLLRLVLENLLGNAWKFSAREPRPRIEFGAMETDGARRYFVRDNGVGFDMAYAGKLFGAFQRLHGMTEFPGTGIGLATVHRIVTRHGGTVSAEAEVGKGATFSFTL